jgi:hypothetical protein
MPTSRLVCVTCGTRFKPKRADAVYCSTGCRQRAYRERQRLDQLERELEAARLRYWEIARRIAVARGEASALGSESQLVDTDGTVYMHGAVVGTTTPHRPGWAAWGLESGGPPHVPPPAVPVGSSALGTHTALDAGESQ